MSAAVRLKPNQPINRSTKLYRPADQYRVRWNTWTDTPLPQEEPAGENPPDGVMIDYYLSDNADKVSLEILDAKGNVIRMKSNNKAVIIDGLENYIIVDTDKALLICPRDNDQLIKDYVLDLKNLKKGDRFI